MTELKRLSEPRDFIKRIYQEIDGVSLSLGQLWEVVDSLQNTVSLLQVSHDNLNQRVVSFLDSWRGPHPYQLLEGQQARTYTGEELSVLVERYK